MNIGQDLSADRPVPPEECTAAAQWVLDNVSLRGLINLVVRVEALHSEVHSGMLGTPAPDALAAFVAILATLRDGKGTSTKTLGGCSQAWSLERLGNRERRADSLRPVGFRNGGERRHIQSAR